MSRSSHKRQLRPEDYTIALICPRGIVLSAAQFMLDEEHQGLPRANRDPLDYVLGSMSGHNVVLATLPAQTHSDILAASITTHLVYTFPRAELRLLVSIGGGIPSESKDMRLGDVVVSNADTTHSGVITYDFGKETTQGFVRTAQEPCGTPAALVEACMKLKHHHRANPNHIANIVDGVGRRNPSINAFHRPPQDTDVLFPSTRTSSDHSPSTRGNAVFRPPRQSPNQIKVLHGMIGAGARLVSDPRRRDELAKEYGVICLDTAAPGFRYYPGLVVCGIYHYCDRHYNEYWSHYAAAAAAACVKQMLSFIPPTVQN
ncbi:purine and uridine phosphorylase [Aspergillus carlsbadensis]|nr:purine and uridine phosphorylase [Aspergillus carlsbadensis]